MHAAYDNSSMDCAGVMVTAELASSHMLPCDAELQAECRNMKQMKRPVIVPAILPRRSAACFAEPSFSSGAPGRDLRPPGSRP